MRISDLREHAGEDFQLQILFVAQSVGTSLDDPDFIVQALDEPQGHFVLRVTIHGTPLPGALNQFRKLLVGLQALPLQGRSPNRVWGKLLAKAELRHIRIHDHSIQITVDTYGHLVPGGNRQAVDKLDGLENATVRNPDATSDLNTVSRRGRSA